MLRKIMLGTLFIGLIGILATGAVIRTMDRTELVAEAHGYGHGHDHDEVGECTEGELDQGHGRDNGEAGAYAAGSSSRGRGGYGRGGNPDGYGSQGRGDAPGEQAGTDQVNVDEWLTLQGTVVSVDVDMLVVQTDSGEQVTMENRPWWFAREQGFSAQVGNQVTLVGFYENGDFEVGQISDVTNGQTLLVRDENGRPLWAGRGRGGGGRWMPGSTS
jgi:hypothetical protein